MAFKIHTLVIALGLSQLAQAEICKLKNGSIGEVSLVDTTELHDAKRTSITMIGKEKEAIKIKKNAIDFIVIQGDTLRFDNAKQTISVQTLDTSRRESYFNGNLSIGFASPFVNKEIETDLGLAYSLSIYHLLNPNFGLGIRFAYQKWKESTKDSSDSDISLVTERSPREFLAIARLNSSEQGGFLIFAEPGLGIVNEVSSVSLSKSSSSAPSKTILEEDLGGLLFSMEGGIQIRRIEGRLGYKISLAREQVSKWSSFSIGWVF